VLQVGVGEVLLNLVLEVVGAVDYSFVVTIL